MRMYQALLVVLLATNLLACNEDVVVNEYYYTVGNDGGVVLLEDGAVTPPVEDMGPVPAPEWEEICTADDTWTEVQGPERYDSATHYSVETHTITGVELPPAGTFLLKICSLRPWEVSLGDGCWGPPPGAPRPEGYPAAAPWPTEPRCDNAEGVPEFACRLIEPQVSGGDRVFHLCRHRFEQRMTSVATGEVVNEEDRELISQGVVTYILRLP